MVFMSSDGLNSTQKFEFKIVVEFPEYEKELANEKVRERLGSIVGGVDPYKEKAIREHVIMEHFKNIQETGKIVKDGTTYGEYETRDRAMTVLQQMAQAACGQPAVHIFPEK